MYFSIQLYVQVFVFSKFLHAESAGWVVSQLCSTWRDVYLPVDGAAGWTTFWTHWSPDLIICRRFVSGYRLRWCQNSVKGLTLLIIIPHCCSATTYQDIWSAQMLINTYPYSLFEAWKVWEARGQIWPCVRFRLLWFLAAVTAEKYFMSFCIDEGSGVWKWSSGSLRATGGRSTVSPAQWQALIWL